MKIPGKAGDTMGHLVAQIEKIPRKQFLVGIFKKPPNNHIITAANY